MRITNKTHEKMIELRGAHDQTMRCEIINALFSDEVKSSKITETEALRLWVLSQEVTPTSKTIYAVTNAKAKIGEYDTLTFDSLEEVFKWAENISTSALGFTVQGFSNKMVIIFEVLGQKLEFLVSTVETTIPQTEYVD